MEIVYIYGLFDPRDNQLRYVGKTINLEGRLRSHIDWARDDVSCPKSDWIKELLRLGLEPVISILEETDEEGWAEAERRWIADCRTKGLKIFNVADGGPNPPDWMGRKQSIYHVRKRVEARQAKGNYHHSEETRKKISEKKKGKKVGPNNPFYGKHHTDETKQKIKANNSWYRPTEEIRKKISEGVRRNPPKIIRKPVSPETRKKMSEAGKGRKLSPEHIEKIRQRNLGSHVSDETKEKLRQANLGKHHSEETRKKIALLSKGRHHSEETRQKMKISNKGRKFSEEQNKQNSQRTKSLWQNPEYRAKMAEAQKKRREREAKEKGAGQC